MSALSVACAQPKPRISDVTTTPIKHVIVIIGENRSFDHVFATYQPKTGPNGLESALRRNCQRRRHSRAQFLQGGAECRYRPGARHVPVESAQSLVSRQRSARAARGRAQRTPTLPGDSLTLAQQSENGLARQLLSVFDFRRYRPERPRLRTRELRTSIHCRRVRSN